MGKTTGLVHDWKQIKINYNADHPSCIGVIVTNLGPYSYTNPYRLIVPKSSISSNIISYNLNSTGLNLSSLFISTSSLCPVSSYSLL